MKQLEPSVCRELIRSLDLRKLDESRCWRELRDRPLSFPESVNQMLNEGHEVFSRKLALLIERKLKP